MSIHDLVFVLGISAASAGQAIGNIYVSEHLLEYEEAVTACRDKATKLVLPLSEAHNNRIRAVLNDQPLRPWIGLQVLSSGWHVHNTELMLLNQGCYNRSSLMFTHNGTHSTIKRCTDYCRRSSQQYAAFQRKNDNAGDCICPSNVPVSAALHDNKCRASCGGSEVNFCGSEPGASYRVLAINATNNFPPWDTSETPPRENIQCASYYWQDTDNIFRHDLWPNSCQEHLPSLCLTSNIISEIEGSNWFEAHKKCIRKGGHLLVPNSTLSTMPTWPKNTHYWTGVTGWIYRESTGSNTGYSSWAGGQPDLTRGNCVFMNSRGSWESSRCDVDRHYICESGNASLVTSSPTAPTSTRSHTMTTPELTSPIPSNSSTRYVSYSTNDNDVMMSSSNEAPVTSSTTTLHSTNTDSISGLSTASMGVAIGLPIAVIIILTVASVLIYRKRHLNKDGVKHQSTPDGSTKETTAVDLDYYAPRGINGVTNNDDSPSPNVAPDQDREAGMDEDEEPPVYATPDKGRTDEGVLIVDNELYDDSQLDEQRPEQMEIGQSALSPVSNEKPNTYLNLQQLSSEESPALYELAEPVQTDHLYSN